MPPPLSGGLGFGVDGPVPVDGVGGAGGFTPARPPPSWLGFGLPGGPKFGSKRGAEGCAGDEGAAADLIGVDAGITGPRLGPAAFDCLFLPPPLEFCGGAGGCWVGGC